MKDGKEDPRYPLFKILSDHVIEHCDNKGSFHIDYDYDAIDSLVDKLLAAREAAVQDAEDGGILQVTTVRLPPAMIKALDEICDQTGHSRSHLISTILQEQLQYDHKKTIAQKAVAGFFPQLANMAASLLLKAELRGIKDALTNSARADLIHEIIHCEVLIPELLSDTDIWHEIREYRTGLKKAYVQLNKDKEIESKNSDPEHHRNG